MISLEKAKELKKMGWPQIIIDEKLFGWFQHKNGDKKYTYATYQEAGEWKYYTDDVNAPSLEDLFKVLQPECKKDINLRSYITSNIVKYFAGEIDNLTDSMADIWIGNINIWVAALDDFDNYIPTYRKIRDLYKGKDALPYFFDRKECDNWCNTHGYTRGKVFEK